MIPKSETLPCGYRVVPYIYQRKFNFEISQRDMSMCDAAKGLMDKERIGHRLENNYSRENLHLGKMFLYNFVFYKDTPEPMFCSGAQIDGDSIRVFSRYFAFKKYRIDGMNMLKNVDNFDELNYSLRYLNHKLIYWSRDKSPKFFHRLKKGRPDIFSEWKVHPNRLQIIYPDNNQYIFYKGNIELMYK